MQLRKATIEDAAPLTLLLREIGWFEAFKSDSVDDSTRRVRAELELCLADGSHSVYVAQTDDRIMGYVSVHWIPYLFMSGPEGYVSELFVRNGERGQGVGTQLLQVVTAEARSRGCSRLALTNLRHRESYQRKYYTKAGWTERNDAARFVFPLD
jgi:GNAT superfamily N-acetyltransferase